MSAKDIISIEKALEHSPIKNYYSAHGLRGSQIAMLKRRGIKFEQRHRAYKWFEIDFSK